MITYLKRGRSVEQKTSDAVQVRDTVTGILEAVAQRGDAAVAELSKKFDNWEPESFRLSQDEIQACLRTLSDGQRSDIEFAQAGVSSFSVQ